MLKSRSFHKVILILIICFVVLPFTSSTTKSQSPETSSILIESDDPQVDQSGTWVSQTSSNASAGAYLYSSGSTDDTLTLAFEGTSIEIIYVKDPNLGDFAIEIDNIIVRTIVTHSDETTFDNRAVVDYLEDGQHTLRVYPVEGVIGIDAFGVSLAADLDDSSILLSYIWDNTLTTTDIKTGETIDLEIEYEELEVLMSETSFDVYDIRYSPLESLPRENYGFYHGLWSPDKSRFIHLEIQSEGSKFRLIFHNLQGNTTQLLYSGDVGIGSKYLDPFGWISNEEVLLIKRNLLYETREDIELWRLNLNTLEFAHEATVPISVPIFGKHTLMPNGTTVLLGIAPEIEIGYTYDILENSISEIRVHTPNIHQHQPSSESSGDYYEYHIREENPFILGVIEYVNLRRYLENNTSANTVYEQHPRVESVSNASERPSPFLYWPVPDNHRQINCFLTSPWTYANYSLTCPGLGINYSYGEHRGTDIQASTGTNIYAAAQGQVVAVVTYCQAGNTECGGGFGNYVKMTHTVVVNGNARTWVTVYAHLQSVSIGVLNYVSDISIPIGLSGNTGFSDGPHLHFEVRNQADPLGNDGAYWDDPWGSADSPHGASLWVGGNSYPISAENVYLGMPTITSPTANQVLSSPFDVTLQPGQLNHTGLYDFHIQIDNNSNFASPEFDNNSNWSTSTTIPVTLAPGNYYIRAQQGDTQSQSSGWTSAVSFTVLSNTPILLNPIGAITDPNLNFEWFESSNSTWYHFVLSNAATNVVVIDQWYQKGSADLPCSNGTCSLTPSMSFAEGDYVWHVLGWDATNGASNWSAPGNFTLDVPAPSAINKIEPDGNITSSTPAFTWDHDPNATWYHVWIGTSANTQLLDQWHEGSSVCMSGTCTVDTGLTFIGDFKWFVQGYGAGGNGPWGSPTNFSYALTLISPSGTVGGTDLDFEWSNAGSTTTWYHLWAGVNGGNAVLDQWVNSSNCGGVTCTYTATSTIPNGDYVWFVQPYGPSYGNGPWSIPKNFTVSPITVDLQIQQQYDNDDPVVAGNTLTYTIIVQNIGAFTATGVTLTDTLPTGVSYTSASQGCSHSSGIVTCNLIDLAPNASTTININLAVNSNTHATITNTASVTSTETDTNPANNADTESTVTFVHDGDANDRGRLYFNQVVSNCTTTGKEERYYYWLAGDYTAPYIFDIQRTSGNLQYDIIVKRASGEWLVATHSSNEGRGIASIEVPQPGDFYIYLIPRPGTSGCYNINIHDNARPNLFYEYPNQSAHSDVQRWQFWLPATHTYRITTDRSDGDVEFTITLKPRSSGQTIATTTTVNGAATIPATSATGWYDVYLTPAAHTHGSYHITITQIN